MRTAAGFYLALVLSMAMAHAEEPSGPWTLVFSDDFNTNVAEGSFLNVYGAKWDAYPWGWVDTSKKGSYDPKILSVSNGILNMRIHTSSDGKHHVAAPYPKLPGGNNNQLYGRYEVRFRSDSIAGYKTAWLLWPQSEVWPRDGEIDFPECDLNGTIHAFMHRMNGTSGGDQDAYSTNAKYTDWHTAVIEWMPNRVNFILDGTTIGSSTRRIPSTPMHWVLQTETLLSGTVPNNTTGKVQIDRVAVWKYTPGKPAISTQPSNKTVTAGQAATFSITATGTPAPSYQWQKNGTNISGATSSSYTTPATAVADNGALFRCVVSNSAGSVTSNAATLTVNPPAQKVSKYRLINCDTNQVIAGYDPIPAGATLNLATLPTRTLSIDVQTDPAVVGSVAFNYDGNANFRTESQTPYALNGDQPTGTYTSASLAVGSHTLICTPYTGANRAGTAGASLSLSFSVIDRPPFAVTISSVASGRAYTTARATVGAIQYIDRSYTLTALSGELTNGVLVRAANADKYATGSSQISLSANGAAKVYICYDKRATALPTWLRDGGWTLTTLSLSSTDTAASPMKVYTKTFAAGSIILGGNQQAPSAGAMTHYIPIIQPVVAAVREVDGSGLEMAELAPADSWTNENDSDGDGLLDAYELGVGLASGVVDSNNNGIMDEDETWSGTGLSHLQRQIDLTGGSNNGGDGSGIGEPIEPAPLVLTVTGFNGSLDFTKAGRDRIAVQAKLVLPAGTNVAGPIEVETGGVRASVVLNAKGAGKSSSVTVKMKMPKANANAGAETTIDIKLKGGYSSAFSIATDVTAKDVAVAATVAIQLGSIKFAGSAPLRAAVTAGKKAKLKK